MPLSVERSSIVFRRGVSHVLSEGQTEEIRKAFGTTTIFALRQAFGADFAHGAADELTVDDALPLMDEHSTAMLMRRLRGRAGSGSI
jgi:hypothetical protein